MKRSLSHVLNIFIEWVLYLLVFLLPITVLPYSLDVLELNKQTLLVVLASLLALAFIGRVLYEKKVILRRGWQNVLPVLFVLGVILSALFSLAPYTSWIGGMSLQYESVLSVLALFVLFFTITHTIDHETRERRLFAVLLLSASVVAFLFLCNLFGASLFSADFLQSTSFNTIGTSNALGVYLLVMSVFGQALWLVSGREHREVLLAGWKGAVEKGLIIFLTFTTAFLLLALDFWALWVLGLVGTGTLFLFGLVRANEFPRTTRFTAPMILAVLSIFFLFLPRPYSAGLPIEVTPSFQASLQIMRGTWAEHGAVLGSGPGTYAFDYSASRPADVIQSSFWDVRFDRAHSYLLTLFTTQGLLVGVTFLLFLLGMFLASLRKLMIEREHTAWKLHFVLLSTWMTLAVSAFLYSWNLTLLTLFFLFSALLASQFLRRQTVVLKESPRASLGFSFLFVLFSIGVLTLLFMTVNRHLAEASFARAVRLDRSQVSIEYVTSQLETSVRLNRLNDVYARNLAQSYLYQLSDRFTSIQGGVTTDEDARVLQALASMAIDAGRRSTDLSPYNVLNWRMRGTIYRELMSLVDGVGALAVTSFERAIHLDPVSPVGYVDLARTHLASASLSATLEGSADANVAKQAKANQQLELQLAKDALDHAILLKPDYAPAQFYLAVVLEASGQIEEAFAKLDAIVLRNPSDVGAAFQMGQLSMRLQRYDRAEAEFLRAIELSPEFANARWFLASVYEIQGRLSDAISEIQKVASLLPDEPIVNARLKRLEEGKKQAEVPPPLPEDENTVITDTLD